MQILFAAAPSLVDPVLSWGSDYSAPWRDEARVAALPEGAWDGPMVRLACYHADPAHMVLQRACFFDYIGTQLTEANCERTDAIGLAALLFTADGQCVLQRRRADLAIRPGLLGPSMSGALEPADLDGCTRLSQLDPRREAREELGVTDDEIGGMRLMGLIREDERHGAPGLLYRGWLQLTAAELSRRTQPEGELLCCDVLRVHELPDRSPPVDNLLHLLIREDMGR